MAKKKAKSRYQKRANRKPEPRLPGNKKPGHRKPVSPGPAPVENTDPTTGEIGPAVGGADGEFTIGEMEVKGPQ